MFYLYRLRWHISTSSAKPANHPQYGTHWPSQFQSLGIPGHVSFRPDHTAIYDPIYLHQSPSKSDPHAIDIYLHMNIFTQIDQTKYYLPADELGLFSHITRFETMNSDLWPGCHSKIRNRFPHLFVFSCVFCDYHATLDHALLQVFPATV